MILTIETDEMKITLTVAPGGVTIDAPVTMDEETRQTTLSEAQWVAYAKGRDDERRDMNHQFVRINGKVVDAKHISEKFSEIASPNEPPKVDPITGNISEHVKSFREANRAQRAKEQQPREECRSACCGTLGAKTRDGSCKGCR